MDKLLFRKKNFFIVFTTDFSFKLRIINDEWTKGFQLWFGFFFIQWIKLIKPYDY